MLFFDTTEYLSIWGHVNTQAFAQVYVHTTHPLADLWNAYLQKSVIFCAILSYNFFDFINKLNLRK